MIKNSVKYQIKKYKESRIPKLQEKAFYAVEETTKKTLVYHAIFGGVITTWLAANGIIENSLFLIIVAVMSGVYSVRTIVDDRLMLYLKECNII